jgi:transcriptional regulator with XRE-family HTH domain
MDTNLIEREHTAARPPMLTRLAPVRPSIPPTFYGGGDLYAGNFMLASVVASTSPAYDALICFLGTAADPVCRIILPSDLPRRTTAQNVLEIRFLSGLTWQEVGELFGVSRRSAHNWANGETLRPDNVALVSEALLAIKALHRPSSTETRIALLAQLPNGRRPLDLLRARLWPEAIAAVKALPAYPIPPSPHPDATQMHPTAYFGALTDSLGSTSGRLIRSRRMRRRTP